MKAIPFCSLLLILPALPASTLTHSYDLTTSLNDVIGSATLNADGRTITRSGYVFAVDRGLNASSALTSTTNDSLLVDVSFSALNRYRKILHFKNLTSDNGVSNLNTDLNYFNFSFGPGSGLVVGYINGVQQFSFSDLTSDAVFSASGGIIRSFEDRFSCSVPERLCSPFSNGAAKPQ